MELVQEVTKLGRSWLVLGVFAMALSGCESTGSMKLVQQEKPPTGDICQVACTWQNEVAHTPDPLHGGAQLMGLSGRVYLFGTKMDFPKAGDGGSLVVDLYDAEKLKSQPDCPPLEEWQIDKDTLAKLQRKDDVGWGYTLFLPWSTYRPDLVRLQMKVRYQPAKGLPLYADASNLTLNNPAANLAVGVQHDPNAPKVRQASHKSPFTGQ